MLTVENTFAFSSKYILTHVRHECGGDVKFIVTTQITAPQQVAAQMAGVHARKP
jgi:hypothetical protein